jgi:hypothetical protein
LRIQQNPVILAATGLAAGSLLAWLARDEPRAAVVSLAVPLVFLGLDRCRNWSRSARTGLAALFVLLAFGFAAELAGEARRNVREPPEWDFLGFWLHARTAAAGGDFYDPATALDGAADLDTSRAFRREIVDTGFWYPPPSMFLFLPLAWLEPQPALVVWYGLTLGAIVAGVALSWRIFFPAGSPLELAAIVALVCAARPTLSTLHFCQTSFLGLLLLLLFWGARERGAGGVWLALAVLVKPFFLLAGLPLVIRARWRPLVAGVATAAVACIAALATFGPATFLHYFSGEGRAPKPEWIYRESTNQSLLGWALRATADRCGGIECATHPWYLGSAVVVTAVTLPLAWRLARRHEGWAIALALLFALLVYPVSQPFYAVTLTPVLLFLWRERDRFRGGAPLVAGLAGGVYALLALDGGRVTVAAVTLLWAATVALGWRLALAPDGAALSPASATLPGRPAGRAGTRR